MSRVFAATTSSAEGAFIALTRSRPRDICIRFGFELPLPATLSKLLHPRPRSLKDENGESISVIVHETGKRRCTKIQAVESELRKQSCRQLPADLSAFFPAILPSNIPMVLQYSHHPFGLSRGGFPRVQVRPPSLPTVKLIRRVGSISTASDFINEQIFCTRKFARAAE